jgi:UDPglucose 6-dehydrogenase
MLPRISVIGLGKLGFPMAVFFADKGFKVIGVDVNSKIVEAVNEKKCPIYEPGFPELLKKSGKLLEATTDYEYAIKNSDISFIFVSTPSENNGNFSTKYVAAAGERIAHNLKNKHIFHLVVLRSTVLLGGTTELKEILEKKSGKKCGVDFGLCYNPEFLALGNVLCNLSNPDFILIGESDKKSGRILSNVYKKCCENDPPIVRTNFSNAELGKILVNTYITVKITYANMMAELCEKIPDANVDVVSQILGYDPRIGRKYLSGGLAYGGTCFPRDNKALTHICKTIGTEARLPKVIDALNHYHKARIVALLREAVGTLKNQKVALLGITFRPDTDITEESASIKIAQDLLEEGAALSIYDPAGLENAKKTLGKKTRYAGSVEECLKGADACVLATPWKEFKSLKPEIFAENMRNPVLIDCWRVLNKPAFKNKLEYFAVGLYHSKG